MTEATAQSVSVQPSLTTPPMQAAYDALLQQQKRLLRFIVDFKKQNNGNSPSMRQMIAGLGLNEDDMETMRNVLKALIDAEFIDRKPGVARSLAVAGYDYVPTKQLWNW